jgi:hypothetical protein
MVPEAVLRAVHHSDPAPFAVEYGQVGEGSTSGGRALLGKGDCHLKRGGRAGQGGGQPPDVLLVGSPLNSERTHRLCRHAMAPCRTQARMGRVTVRRVLGSWMATSASP